MEDKNELPQPCVPTENEKLERQWKNRWKELKIARMRAAVVASQIVESYKILEIIRFDYVNDTMFRDYITTAKKNLELASSDFLMSGIYHEKRIYKHSRLTFKEYDESLKQPTAQSRSIPE